MKVLKEVNRNQNLLHSIISNPLKITLVTSLLMPAIGVAGTLNVTANNGLQTSFLGSSDDRQGGSGLITTFQDTSFLRNGIDGASFAYRLQGQVSAEKEPFSAGGSTASARLFGDLDFNFNLQTAIWTMQVTTTYRGGAGFRCPG
ncbi:MAG: hypothetical protein V3U84_09565 [Thiotrichaceae bacterium]